MILQLIPLIALCCVLQRNRKPSHPSRHVVGAVRNPQNLREASFALVWVTRQKSILLLSGCSLTSRSPSVLTGVEKAVNYFLLLLFFRFDHEMIQLQVHLQLPCYDFCFLYWRNIGELSSKRGSPVRSPVLHHHRKQRRAVCTNGRDVIGTVWWAAPTRHSSLRDQ